MQSHVYSSYDGSSYTDSDSGDVSYTSVTSQSDAEPAPPTTQYCRFDLETVPVEDGLDFLKKAKPITAPDELAPQFLAGDMTPKLVYHKQKKVLQIGVNAAENISIEVNGNPILPNTLVDLHHGFVVRLAFRTAGVNYPFNYIYRVRHVFQSPVLGGMHYVELCELGKGACGIVRRCRAIAEYGVFGNVPYEVGDVAVKVIDLPEKTTMSEALREVNMMKALNDVPGVVTMSEAWGNHQLRELYIVMQLATHGCLRQLIHELRDMSDYVREIDACHFAFHALRAIGTMHARGIIHGDIKPANFLRMPVPNGSLLGLISDLGGAKHTSELQQDHVYVRGYSPDARCRIGKPSAWTGGYSAPEMGKADADARAHDMHCFGATLFEIMTKRKLVSEKHYCRRGLECKDAACTGRRRVYHFTALREGYYSRIAYNFIKQLVFPDAPHLRMDAAMALRHPWFTMPQEAMLRLTPDFVDETTFVYERDAYIARVEGRQRRVAGPAPRKTEVPSKETGPEQPQLQEKQEENKMDTDEELYGSGEWATEDSSASFRVSVDDLEAGQEMHVWKIEHYRHDPAGVAPVMDEWQMELPEAEVVAQPQEPQEGNTVQAS